MGISQNNVVYYRTDVLCVWQVSYVDSCPCLSDRIQFPSFFRTMPSDDFQVKHCYRCYREQFKNFLDNLLIFFFLHLMIFCLFYFPRKTADIRECFVLYSVGGYGIYSYIFEFSNGYFIVVSIAQEHTVGSDY